jgi:hypothetical protein
MAIIALHKSGADVGIAICEVPMTAMEDWKWRDYKSVFMSLASRQFWEHRKSLVASVTS